MVYEVMMKRFDKMILQNMCLEEEKESIKKKSKECQHKLSHAEKTINSINKGKAKLDEILIVGRHNGARHDIGYIGKLSGVKKNNPKVVLDKTNVQQNKEVKQDKVRK